ncbi:phage tail protein, partial [Escherichia coli]|uniref:phage tail protein n=1 Tax=Escherichia coli TaxID=562 RepID=UPI00227EE64B
MAIKGLEQAVENLSRISRTEVPGGAAMAINRVASSAVWQWGSEVGRETQGRSKR